MLLWTVPVSAAILFSSTDLAHLREAKASPLAQAIRRDAERAVTAGPWSVTFQRPQGTPAQANDFFSEGPYWWPDPRDPKAPYLRRDGVVNPDRFTANDTDMGHMSDAVLTLGAAAFLYEDPQFTRRAIEVVRVWFVDPKTRMNPNLEFGQGIRNRTWGRGTGIIDSRPLIHCVQGLALLERSPGWDPATGDAVKQWFRDYTRWLTTSKKGLDEKKSGNNHAAWWTAQVAAFAAWTGDSETLNMAAGWYRTTLIPGQFTPEGRAPREEERTKSLSYTVFNLEAFAILCRVAATQGIDLWKFQAPSGASLRTAVEFAAPFLAAPASWKLPQIVPFEPGKTYLLALAGTGLKRQDWVDQFRQSAKPTSTFTRLISLLVAP